MPHPVNVFLGKGKPLKSPPRLKLCEHSVRPAVYVSSKGLMQHAMATHVASYFYDAGDIKYVLTGNR